jgi:hypothetical protein
MATDAVADIYQKPGVPYSLVTDIYSTTAIGGATPTVEAASVVNPIIADGLPGTLLPGVNLLQKTQVFDDVYWVKTRTTVTANAIAAPDATLTADKLIEAVSTANTHTLSAANVVATSDLPYIWSVYVKAGERTRIRLRGGWTSGFLGDLFVNLLNGSVINATTAALTMPIVGVINAGNGWYRIWMKLVTSPLTTFVTFQLWMVDVDTNTTYIGDGVSGVYIWGAQLEQANALHAYTAVP